MDIPRLPPPPGPAEVPAVSDRDVAVGEWGRNLITDLALSHPRARQAHLGPSEIGQACERRLAYRIAGTPIVNLADPILTSIGQGWHAGIAEGLRRIQGGRYLVETPVSYRGISGSVDVFDRARHRLVDWKTTSPRRIHRYRREGIGINYRVQINIYAQGLIAAGERVDEVALVFVPREGDLSDVAAFVFEPDQQLADEYIDRYFDIYRRVVDEGGSPAEVDIRPGPLCTYCPNYSRAASNLEVACPGGVTA